MLLWLCLRVWPEAGTISQVALTLCDSIMARQPSFPCHTGNKSEDNCKVADVILEETANRAGGMQPLESLSQIPALQHTFSPYTILLLVVVFIQGAESLVISHFLDLETSQDFCVSQIFSLPFLMATGHPLSTKP